MRSANVFTADKTSQIKAYLEPAEFQGRLTVNNWQDGNPGCFQLLDTESKTVAAEFRNTDDMPDDWDPEITWTSSDESVLKVTAAGDDDHLPLERTVKVTVRVNA